MKTVLIAEDDAVITNNLQKALVRKGLDVLIADNGIAAVKIIKEKEPPVLLLDINLPGLSGIKILEEIKNSALPTKVIVITGTFDSETERKSLELGAFAFLKKPFMIEVVFKLLGDLKLLPEL
ncbi:MAG: response regulator [Candidatus Omnitrophica bacterium]|nr:response regulator [Candidatus Omnitrophota bacterium]